MRMVAAGDFPSTSAPTGMRRGAPRVGDGVIHLDVEGVVRYASPNAVSAVHRMGHVGDVIGEVLAQVVADLASRSGGTVDESLAVVATGRAAWRSEVETASATITMRAIPLIVGRCADRGDGAHARRLRAAAARAGAAHQGRDDPRDPPPGEEQPPDRGGAAAAPGPPGPDEAARAALEEAVRRVGTIALVHETLSQGFDETVNFDEIAVRGLRAVVEVATREHRVESTFTGSFGRMRAEDATALAMIVSELVQNAVEHGLADRDGMVEVAARARDPRGRRGAADGRHHRRRRGAARGFPAGARRARDADRHLARGGPAGADPLGERVAARDAGRVRRAAAAAGPLARRGRSRQPARRARALRRLRARRSSSDMPPHTPAS